MKILFAALMCLVLGRSQCFAISGGPVYPGSLNVVGTFGGVLMPGEDNASCGANSLGVFSIGVPQTGVASGAFVMFSQGRVFTGTVRGTADPGNATLKGILEATFDFTVTRTIPTQVTTTVIDPVTGLLTVTTTEELVTTTTQVTASANGALNTTITSAPRASSTASTRLQGTATLDISQGQVDADNAPIPTCALELTVIGFKQSNIVSTT